MNIGILGTRASWAADVNLIAQVVLLAVLVAGVIRAKRRNLDVHHTWMRAVVVVNAVLIIAIMNPSFFRLLPSAVRNPGAVERVPVWPHVLIGALAELLGIYAVLWIKTDVPESLRVRNIKWLMRITFLLWAVALVGGIVLYFVWYM